MFDWLKRLSPHHKSKNTARRQLLTRARYLVEALEDRTLLTTYTFTEISHSSGPASSYGTPALNNNGDVAFNADLDSGGAAIFRGSGGNLTTMADDSGPFRNILGPPSINDAGTVAFWAKHDELGDAGIYSADGTTVTPIVEEIGPTSDFYVDVPEQSRYPTINNSGSVAFVAVGADQNTDGIYVSAGGTPTLVTDTSGPFSSLAVPTINDSGLVAVAVNLDTGGESIVTSDSGAITTIATENPAGPASDIFTLTLSLNNSGTVAFAAFLAEGAQTTQIGILTGNGGPLNTVVETSGFSRTGGPYTTFGQTSINDNGLVAFGATLNDGNPLFPATGIFSGPDPSCQSVIQTGQTLAGRTVQNLGLVIGPEALNNAGRIAFRASFTDGTSGVYRADPVAAGNLPPTADAGSTSGLSYRVQAGSTVMLDASRSSDCDQAAGSLTYEWDFDNDGQFNDATGVTPTFSAAGLNGPATVTVGLRVTDSGGLSSTDTATVIIDAPAPGISNFSATSPILVSQSTTLTGTVTIDTSVRGSAKVAVTWGDRKKGKLKVTAETTALNLLHQYKLPGTFTITATLTRKKVVVATIMTTVTVQSSAVQSVM